MNCKVVGQICRGLFQSAFLAFTLCREQRKLSVRFPANIRRGQILATVPKRRHSNQLEFWKNEGRIFHLLMSWTSEWSWLANTGACRRSDSCVEWCSVIQQCNVVNACYGRKGDGATWQGCLHVQCDPDQLPYGRLDVPFMYGNKIITYSPQFVMEASRQATIFETNWRINK